MGMFNNSGAQAPAAGGGMFAGVQSAPPAQAAAVDPAMKQQWIQMAQSIIQSPTPQTVQQVLAALRQADVPETDQLEQGLAQLMDQPEKLREIATQTLQALQAQ